jgi:hypothetical protein
MVYNTSVARRAVSSHMEATLSRVNPSRSACRDARWRPRRCGGGLPGNEPVDPKLVVTIHPKHPDQVREGEF